jgi:hypothetical protein
VGIEEHGDGVLQHALARREVEEESDPARASQLVAFVLELLDLAGLE